MKRLVLVFLLAVLLVPAVMDAAKLRIAVMVFENNASSEWRSWNLGKAAQDAMITALVDTDLFTVIERQKLDMILAEQNLGQSGAITSQSAAKVGRLLGVQVVITGSVTQFGKTKTGGGISGLLGGSAVEWEGALDARMINVNTGEIISVAKGEGSATGGGIHIKGVHVGSRGSYNERAGSVMREAVEDIAEQFADKAETLIATMGSSAKVALVKSGKVYISAGLNYDVEIGDIYEVIRQGEAIIDPDTGLELDREEEVVGVLEVIKVKAKLAICKINSGTVDKGDIVKKK